MYISKPLVMEVVVLRHRLCSVDMFFLFSVFVGYTKCILVFPPLTCLCFVQLFNCWFHSMWFRMLTFIICSFVFAYAYGMMVVNNRSLPKDLSTECLRSHWLIFKVMRTTHTGRLD